MARAAGFYLCLLIVIIDVVAGILGIVADNAQNKEKHLNSSECVEPSHQAFMLALAAVIFLGIAHALANFAYRCGNNSETRKLSTVCLILTWASWIGALSSLIPGVMLNKSSRVSCGFLMRHILLIGGSSCFVHGLTSVVYYVLALPVD